MKINTLHLQNFRSHADTTLTCERLTVIRGANHVGKSSIPYALEFVTAGRCPGTTSDGKGAAALVREGEKKATIIIDGSVKVEIDAKGSRKGDESMRDRNIWSCLTNTGYFYTMPPAAQKDLLSSLVLPADYSFPEWVHNYIDALSLGKNLLAPGMDLPERIDAIYKAAFDYRTDAKRTAKAFVIPTGDVTTARDPQSSRDRLAALRKELVDLESSQKSAGAERNAHQTKVDAAEQYLNKANAALSRDEQELPGIKARILSKKALADATKDAKGIEQFRELQRLLREVEPKIAERKASMEALKKMKTGTCDKCGQTLTEEAIAHLHGLVSKEYDDLGFKRSTWNDELKALGNPEEAAKSLQAHDTALAEEKRVNERIAEARKEVDEARKAFEALPEPPAAGEDFSERITELQSRIAKGEQVVSSITAANKLLADQEAAKIKFAELEETIEMLDKMVEFFGPKGIKARLLDDSISGFQDAMNAVLAGWGYECNLQFEPYEFSIITKANGRRPLSALSESEQHHFAVALQVALAMWSGHKFVVVDRADVMVPESRGMLNKTLWASKLDQAIVIGTDMRDSVDKKVAGVAVYMLSMPDGETTSVERLA